MARAAPRANRESHARLFAGRSCNLLAVTMWVDQISLSREAPVRPAQTAHRPAQVHSYAPRQHCRKVSAADKPDGARGESSMANDATVPQDLADKFKTEKDSPYLRFVRAEGLDVISAQYVPNLRTVELKPWPRKSSMGVFINHEGSRTSNDCYVCEIAPGKKLEPQHHLFEEMILVLSGRGSTAVWNNAGVRVTFEWKAGAIFAIPLNCWYQHFNGSGQESVRYVAVTNAPSVINLYDDIDFVFNHLHDFKNRFSGEPDYYSGKGEQVGFLLQTNFVADAINLPLIAAKERGAGGGHIRFNMARGSIASHISQFPVGTYKKAHAHGPGAHVIVLSGEGYSLMWPQGEEPRRFDWQVGTLIVPPNAWFHQHFNSGPTLARYLAFKHWTPRNAQGVPMSWI